MAKLDKLMKSFEAFINNDTKSATQMYREFFIESAQEINKNLEEDLEESIDAEGDEQLEEAFGDDMGDDLMSDIEVEDEEATDEFGGEEDFGAEEDFGGEEEAADAPGAEEWAEIQDAFDELEALFDELGGAEGEEDDAELDFEAEDDFGGDELEFGDEDEGEELDESIQMKAVKDPNMKSEKDGVNKTSIVSKKAKSPMGVKGTDGWTKDGTVSGSNTDLDTSSAETPKVDDQNNVMDSGKGAYKKTQEPNMKSEEGGVHSQSLVKDMR